MTANSSYSKEFCIAAVLIALITFWHHVTKTGCPNGHWHGCIVPAAQTRLRPWVCHSCGMQALSFWLVIRLHVSLIHWEKQWQFFF